MKKEKWLLRKSSGSRSKYHNKPNYADARNPKLKNLEEAPYREPISKGTSWLDTSLVKRWLYSQVGKNFDQVYSAFLKRIQPKYLVNYRDCIYYYVDKKEEVKLSKIGSLRSWNKRFYIDPDTNILSKYPDRIPPNKKIKKTRFGYFHYDEKDQNWVSTYIFDIGKVVVSKGMDQLSDSDLERIEFYISRISTIQKNTNTAINEQLIQGGFRFSLENPKYNLGLYFEDENSFDKYHFEVEILMLDDFYWRVLFDGFEVVEVLKINKKKNHG